MAVHRGDERLSFIDGLRGIAAVIVALGHAVFVADGLRTSGSFLEADTGQRLAWLVRPGVQMVYLFLMVSAFSLVYSEDSRRAVGRAATPVRTFLRRRAWRILPTYYVALLVSVPLAFLTVDGRLPDQFADLRPSVEGSLAHLVLLHNVSESWRFEMNAPLWSLAYEAQIYLVFPVLYVLVRRSLLLSLLVLAGSFTAVNTMHVLPRNAILGYWFVLGAIVAAHYRRLPDRLVALLLPVGVAALISSWFVVPFTTDQSAQDIRWSVAFVALLIWMARRPAATANPCNWRLVGWLGVRSYSLYVMHFPLFWLLFVILTWSGLEPVQMVPVMLLLGMPVAVLLAHLTYEFVERPSLRRARTSPKIESHVAGVPEPRRGLPAGVVPVTRGASPPLVRGQGVR